MLSSDIYLFLRSCHPSPSGFVPWVRPLPKQGANMSCSPKTKFCKINFLHAFFWVRFYRSYVFPRPRLAPLVQQKIWPVKSQVSFFYEFLKILTGPTRIKLVAIFCEIRFILLLLTENRFSHSRMFHAIHFSTRQTSKPRFFVITNLSNSIGN